MQTQWRVGLAVTGLDYNAVAHAARWLGLDMSPELLGRLMRLEQLTLDKLREEQEKRHVAGADKNRHQRPG